MNRIHVAITAFIMTLSGCGGGFLPANTASDPQTRASDPFGSLSLDMPNGFCLNGKYSERADDKLFALIHSCNSNAAKGFYTLSIRQLDRTAGRSNIQSIKSMLADPSQQRIISGLVVEQKTVGNIHFVRAQNTGRPLIPLTDADYWRSFFLRDGMLYTVSFLPAEGSDLSSNERLKMVQVFSKQLRR